MEMSYRTEDPHDQFDNEDMEQDEGFSKFRGNPSFLGLLSLIIVWYNKLIDANGTAIRSGRPHTGVNHIDQEMVGGMTRETGWAVISRNGRWAAHSTPLRAVVSSR